jgi:biopolymer transport protein ExbB/TolQ/biopolymer transport protein ExbD
MEFIDIFNAGGPIMLPLFLISLAAVALAVERAMAYRQFGVVVPGFVQEILELVRNGREQEALRLAEETPGPVAANLALILRGRRLPVNELERRAATAGEEYFIRLERFLPALDTFTTLSPLLGLLGTILGMVKVFQQFTAANNDEAAKARILAGVGESLYATAFGITIAVFCFAVYNYFSSRQRTISLDTAQGAQRLLAFYHARNAAAGIEETESGRRRGVAGSKGRELKKTKVEIIPMIDTMFFLLVFFILSSVGIIKLAGQKVNLPSAANSEQQKPAQVTVSINANKIVKVNNTDVPKGADVGPYLKREVQRQVGGGRRQLERAIIVISADTDVANGVVVRTIDESRAVGISHFAIATAPVATAPVDPAGP